VRRVCSSARLRAKLHPARVQARTIPGASRARPPCLRHARHDGTRPPRAPSTTVAPRHPRAGGVARRHAQSGAPRACSERGMPLSTSAVRAGIPAWLAACSARARAARAVFVRRRRIAIPATTSSWAALEAGGKGAGSSSGERTLGLVAGARSGGGAGPRDSARARHLCGHRVLRASPALRRAPSQASPGRARRARSRPRRRHTARGPRPLSDRRPRAAFRRRVFARTRSPSCAIAMTRSASAGASSRKAIRFSAPRDHPLRAHAPRP